MTSLWSLSEEVQALDKLIQCIMVRIIIDKRLKGVYCIRCQCSCFCRVILILATDTAGSYGDIIGCYESCICCYMVLVVHTGTLYKLYKSFTIRYNLVNTVVVNNYV